MADTMTTPEGLSNKKVAVNLEYLGVLASTAERNGTQDRFIAVALQWASEASAAIAELRAEVERLRTVVDQAGITITVSPEGVLWEIRGAARAEVERCKADANLALGALADIASSNDMTLEVAQNKARRVYTEIRAARAGASGGAACE